MQKKSTTIDNNLLISIFFCTFAVLMNTILLITPPLTQLNCAYPATAQLCGFLRKQGIQAEQQDLSIELIHHILQADSLRQIFNQAEELHLQGKKLSKAARIAVSNRSFFEQWVEPVSRFLRGKDLSLQNRFADRTFWPNANRLPSEEDLDWDYGSAGSYNRAQFFCTYFLEEIGRVIQETVSPHFEMVRYAEKLCMSLPNAAPLYEALSEAPNCIDQWMLQLLEKRINELPNLTHIGFSVPFPGNLYAALRCAQFIKANYPKIRILMGGGYVNTELRQIADTQLFSYIDDLLYDDGELPLLRLLTDAAPVRTIRLNEDGQLMRLGWESAENKLLAKQDNIPFREIGTPCLDGLHLDWYLDTADAANPMQRLWSNGRWNKLMMAHGCYWAKCTFCDTTLDYIGRFDSAPATEIADRMDGLFAQSGESGFHFTDEAMPPAIVRQLSEELLARKRTYSWWGNIRFESFYSNEICYLMHQAGCIAVSGGIEVASDRVLKRINKGVSIDSLKQTLRHFRDNHIMVHAYLMYGFPTETEAELMESLNTVRLLFNEGLIQSAFWHRYAMTCHSESGQHPERFDCEWTSSESAPFANNEIGFTCKNAPDWNRFGRGLQLATENYMRGAGLDIPVKQWFR